MAEKFSFPIERARTLLEIGRRTADARLVAEAAGVFSQTGAKVYWASALHASAQILARAAGASMDVLYQYDGAIAALAEVKMDYELGVACAEYARLQQHQNRRAEARESFTKALTLFESTGAQAEHDGVQRELAGLDA